MPEESDDEGPQETDPDPPEPAIRPVEESDDTADADEESEETEATGPSGLPADEDPFADIEYDTSPTTDPVPADGAEAADEDGEDANGDAEKETDGDDEESEDIGDRGDPDNTVASAAIAEHDRPVAEEGPTKIEPGELDESAPDDEEMPLADHIEEMVKRVGVVVIAMAVVSGLVFPFATRLINFLWFSYLPGPMEACPAQAATTVQALQEGGAACARVYHPLAVILARLKVATLVGFVVALPLFVYETYLFMRPGLYPRERRYYLASVPTSLVLAAIGMVFAHQLIIPLLFNYFVSYSEGVTVIAFGLTETFDLIVLMLGAFTIVFQIPLFIMLALMMGLVTREWLVGKRLIFWGVFVGLAYLFTADPTGLGPLLVAGTMIVLFEGTLLLARWTGRG